MRLVVIPMLILMNLTEFPPSQISSIPYQPNVYRPSITLLSLPPLIWHPASPNTHRMAPPDVSCIDPPSIVFRLCVQLILVCITTVRRQQQQQLSAAAPLVSIVVSVVTMVLVSSVSRTYRRLPRRPPFLLVLSVGIGVTSCGKTESGGVMETEI